MNVELFVGTLTRYYSGDWQNGRTRAGAPTPFGPQQPRGGVEVSDPVELQGILAEWLERTNEKLKAHLREPLARAATPAVKRDRRHSTAAPAPAASATASWTTMPKRAYERNIGSRL